MNETPRSVLSPKRSMPFARDGACSPCCCTTESRRCFLRCVLKDAKRATPRPVLFGALSLLPLATEGEKPLVR
jgi:hypothetical protein